MQVWLGTTLLSDSLAVAAQSLVARSLAAQQPAAARTVVSRTAQLSGALGFVLLGGLGACHSLLPRAFSSDPAVLAAVRFPCSETGSGMHPAELSRVPCCCAASGVGHMLLPRMSPCAHAVLAAVRPAISDSVLLLLEVRSAGERPAGCPSVSACDDEYVLRMQAGSIIPWVVLSQPITSLAFTLDGVLYGARQAIALQSSPRLSACCLDCYGGQWSPAVPLQVKSSHNLVLLACPAKGRYLCLFLFLVDHLLVQVQVLIDGPLRAAHALACMLLGMHLKSVPSLKSLCVGYMPLSCVLTAHTFGQARAASPMRRARWASARRPRWPACCWAAGCWAAAPRRARTLSWRRCGRGW